MKKLFLYLRRLLRNEEDDQNYLTNLETKRLSEQILKQLDIMERDKLDRIMEKLHIKEETLKEAEESYDEAKRLYPRSSESAERTAFVRGVKWQYKRRS